MTHRLARLIQDITAHLDQLDQVSTMQVNIELNAVQVPRGHRTDSAAVIRIPRDAKKMLCGLA